MRDDDVVEGGVAFAEAGEADFEDHCCWRGGWGREGVFEVGFAEFDRAEVGFFTGTGVAYLAFGWGLRS